MRTLVAALMLALVGNADARTLPAALPDAAPLALTGCAHFAANAICKPLPANPAISAHSAAWAALEFQPGRDAFATLPVVGGDFPVEVRAGATVSVVIACDRAPWSAAQCTRAHTNGIALDVPANMVPSPNSDHHYTYFDYARQGEYDFWLASSPGPPGATMHVGGLGFCPWSGDGTNCSGSTATNLASTLGLGWPAELVAGEGTPTGTLGHALAASALCADPTWVPPATYSDGANTNGYAACLGHTGAGDRPPEGTRWFLNETDAQIDALGLRPYEAAVFRTLDREHFGGIITDTTWSEGQGLNLQWTYGDYGAASGGGDLVFPLGSIVLARDVVFCSSGTC